ncbi:MAG: cyclodeaminase/cyclohydrolase family protein [Planctomycetota bacterium]|jgi:formiminotetrahydrofolate cyclodeaminase|nr:cyclodeaminase/cyclohydrolase family protein [Planctomycetota bacterium]
MDESPDDLSRLSVREFVKLAASGEPVPGGGAVASLAGALGTAMAAMAANFTVGKPQFAGHEDLMRRSLSELGPIIESLTLGVDADARAFSGLSRAYRFPRDSEEAKRKRREAIQAALLAAARAPERALADCLRAASLLSGLAEAANPSLLSDVEVAAIMLAAAAKAARVNILANTRNLAGDAARQAETEAEKATLAVERLANEALSVIGKRRGD